MRAGTPPGSLCHGEQGHLQLTAPWGAVSPKYQHHGAVTPPAPVPWGAASPKGHSHDGRRPLNGTTRRGGDPSPGSLCRTEEGPPMVTAPCGVVPPPPSRSTTGDDAPLGQRSGAAPAGIHAPGVTQWLVSAGGERGRSLSITASKLRMNIMTAPSSFFTGTTSTRHRKQLPADGGGEGGKLRRWGGLGGVGYPRPLPHRAPPRPGAAPSPALLSGRGPRSAPPLRSDWAVSVCVCRGGGGIIAPPPPP